MRQRIYDTSSTGVDAGRLGRRQLKPPRSQSTRSTTPCHHPLGNRKFGTYTMKRVAAGALLPTPWLFDPAKRSDDRADYCLVSRAIFLSMNGVHNVGVSSVYMGKMGLFVDCGAAERV